MNLQNLNMETKTKPKSLNKMKGSDHYFNVVDKYQLYGSTNRLKFYLLDILFKGIDFKGKTVLDIGGGNGLYSFYAACMGAKKVVVMEPVMDGSSDGFEDEFNDFKEKFGTKDNIVFNKDFLQEYDPGDDKYDVVLMHYSINHLDEQACEDLIGEKKEEAKAKYIKVLKDLVKMSSNNSTLIITDASRYNFYQKFGITNPIAPSIEWEKHNTPKVWAALLKEVGYTNPVTQWLALNAFGKLGKIVLGNKVGSYFLHSFFYLKMDLKK